MVARDAMIELSTSAALTVGDISAANAAEWYERDRARNVIGPYSAVLADIDENVVGRSARYAAQPLFNPDAAIEDVFIELMLTSVEDYVRNAARETVAQNAVRDSANGGWYRIPEFDACDFCLMLTDRGAVYSEDTVGFAAHNNCRCEIGSVWDGGGREASSTARKVSEYIDHLTPAQREQRQASKNVLARNWIENNKDHLDQLRSEL